MKSIGGLIFGWNHVSACGAALHIQRLGIAQFKYGSEVRRQSILNGALGRSGIGDIAELQLEKMFLVTSKEQKNAPVSN